MNEQLTVKNFGPIHDATVDFKRVTVFIGPTGGGKSTLAKLAAVFREFKRIGHPEANEKILEFYQIKAYAFFDSSVFWKIGDLNIILKQYKLSLDDNFKTRLDQEVVIAHGKLASRGNFPSLNELLKVAANPISDSGNGIDSAYRVILEQIIKEASQALIPEISVHYIPADRVYLPAITHSLAGLMRDNQNLPKTLLEFINTYITARYNVKNLRIDYLEIEYRLQGDEDFITNSENSFDLHLNEAASGIQSNIPLVVTVEYLTKENEFPRSFIIEEPELNLYPTAQQGLMNWLVEKCTKGENDLTITTHSPYILASCNLLLEAYKVAQQRPDLEAEIAALVPKESWLNPDEFAAYYVADGTVKPITDVRTHLIGINELDAISGDIAERFYQLLRLQKQKLATA